MRFLGYRIDLISSVILMPIRSLYIYCEQKPKFTVKENVSCNNHYF